MFKIGEIVRYNPKWCSAGEMQYLHVIRENRLNPVTNTMSRYLIETINMQNMTIHPTETVDDFMIQPTGFNIHDLKEGATDRVQLQLFRIHPKLY